REIRKVEKTVQQTENDVSRLEDEILEMQTELSNPEKASDSEFVMQLQKKERELEQKIYEWEISSEQLEELKAKLK
ncbi:MAG: glycosyl transferase family 2, partial [Paludibacter sp.]